MNFIHAFEEGQRGQNQGLPMGKGLQAIEMAINGIQRGRTFAVGAGPKVGKSTLVDYAFVISPALFVLANNAKYSTRLEEVKTQLQTETDQDVRAVLNREYDTLTMKILDYDIIYLSYEIDRVSKEFDFIAYFLEEDFGISYVDLPVGRTHKKNTRISINSSYLRGQMKYDKVDPNQEDEIIKVSPALLERIKTIYKTRIVPLFGEFDHNGNQIKKGLIIFIEHKTNPTGIRNYLLDYAGKNGSFIKQTHTKQDGTTYETVLGYKPNNPKKYTVVICDHVRKILPERGFTKKDTIDKFSEYAVELKNWCKFTFVHIVHLNRGMADIARRKMEDDRIFPTPEDFKDSGNLSEDCDYIFTMFNPNDDKYHLKKHFGAAIRRTDNTLIYPQMRTIHLVESRHCLCPQHFRVNMNGETKNFTPLTI
jgi:hypothetical protein